MQLVAVRGVMVRSFPLALAAVLTSVAGCGSPAGEQDDRVGFAERFLSDRTYRRASLEASVVDPDNGYSALRLAKYATTAGGEPSGWDALAEWNPAVHPFVLGAEEPAAPVWDGRAPTTLAGFRDLGRRAFELWPVQLDDAAGTYATGAADRERFGLWTDDRGRVAGQVHVATADGGEHGAWTCSGCHARPDASGRLVHGAPAASLDRGGMNPPSADGSAPPGWQWRRGTMDVTDDGIDDPVAIPDLRATAHQSHLHHEATLANGLPALAVRVESLLIENLHEQLRPPRVIAVALALYIESLGEQHGSGGVPESGSTLFDDNCGSCHHEDGSTAPPIPATIVGTDPTAADSPMRGHGVYRVPSLWAAGDRELLLHDGSVRDLPTLLDPARVATAPGHPFGLDLSAADRARLVSFVQSIGR